MMPSSSRRSFATRRSPSSERSSLPCRARTIPCHRSGPAKLAMDSFMDRRRHLAIVAVLVGLALLVLLLPYTHRPASEAACVPSGSSVTEELVSRRGSGEPSPSEGSFPREALIAPKGWLSILDRETFAALVPRELVVIPRGGKPVRLDGNKTGSVLSAELCGPCELRASAPGYVPIDGTLELVRGENRVLLQRSGSLAVVLDDAGGEAVPGVEVILIPPRVDSDGGTVAAEA